MSQSNSASKASTILSLLVCVGCGSDPFLSAEQRNFRNSSRTLDATVAPESATEFGADMPLPDRSDYGLRLRLIDAAGDAVLPQRVNTPLSIAAGQLMTVRLAIAAGQDLLHKTRHLGIVLKMGGIVNPTLVSSSLKSENQQWNRTSNTTDTPSNRSLVVESLVAIDSVGWQEALEVKLVIPKETPDNTTLIIATALVDLEAESPTPLGSTLLNETLLIRSSNQARVAITMQWQTEQGQPIAAAVLSDQFFLAATVRDTATEPAGVISAFVNVGFDGLVEGDPNIENGRDYSFLPSGFVEGTVVTDIGGHATTFPNVVNPGEAALLFTIGFIASQRGIFAPLVSEPTGAGLDILIQGVDRVIPFGEAAISTPPPLPIRER